MSAAMVRDPAQQQGSGSRESVGALILDEDGLIRTVSPFAEQILGWYSSELVGTACPARLSCEDEGGQPHCTQCGLATALGQHRLVPPRLVQITDAAGQRRSVDASFWYLPPSGRFTSPRVMMVVRGRESIATDPRYGRAQAEEDLT